MLVPVYHTESQQILEHLLSIKDTLVGGTHFRLGDISLDIEGRDGIGGLIQEWFGHWAQNQGYNVVKEDASQEFPDFYIGLNQDYLEIKSFNYDASPAFDIANFESYCNSLSINPHKLNADYLIFGYSIQNGSLSIQDIWLKKIWEITCASDKYPLRTQIKRGVIYNIRPATWYSNRGQYLPFNDPQLFVNALYDTQQAYKGRSDKALYLQNLSQE